MIFSVTWVPYVSLHFLSFAIQLDLSDDYGLRTFFLSLIALTPTLNTLTRVLCDPSLKQKLTLCKKNNGGGERASVLESVGYEKQDESDLT